MAERPGLLLIISGPSGAGKTTIARGLLQRLGAVFSVSMTTRPRTAADTQGVDYDFVDTDRFEQAIERGELLEWAKVFDRYYGTPREPVERHLAEGRDVLLEIDVQGGVQVKQAKPKALAIFILPPSEQELLERLRRRAREDEQAIQRRFREAQHEIRTAQSSGAYDHFIVNEQVEDAIDDALRLIEQRRRGVSA